MCTKDGAAFIEEQLDSILKQTHKNMHIYISDNDSNDQTATLIQKFIEINNHLKVYLVKGKNKHFANNFIELTQSIERKYDYYAFCDQDDVWHPSHILRAIKKIEDKNINVPSLHCSRTNLVNEKGFNIGKSKLFNKKPSFNNALVQSIAGGNTMVFNYQAVVLLRGIKSNKYYIPSHDWMLYLLVSGCGGYVFYEKKPTVNYRQHSNNTIGSNLGIVNAFKRVNLILNGAWSNWLDANYQILKNCSVLTEENLFSLENFHKLRKADSFFIRIKRYLKSSIYRQTFSGSISILIALAIKKL
jgi:glycosyltransferase involved in cell wall biosynthesis